MKRPRPPSPLAGATAAAPQGAGAGAAGAASAPTHAAALRRQRRRPAAADDDGAAGPPGGWIWRQREAAAAAAVSAAADRRARGSSSRPLLALGPLLLLLLLLLHCAAAQQEEFHHVPLQPGALGRLSPLVLAERVEGSGGPITTPLLRGRPSNNEKGAMVDVVGGSEAVYRPLTTLDPRLTAYFARVAFGGGQELELLVDTGSPALLLPVAPSPELGSEPGRIIEEVPPTLDAPTSTPPSPSAFSSRDTAPTTDPALPPPPLARLNHTLAGAVLIPCDDIRCTGRCHAPDSSHYCGPHGGSCTRSPLAPPVPPTTNNKRGGAVSGGGLPSLPPHVPAEQCSFNWSYGAGQYASRATGVLMRGSVALGPMVVPDATFGAILKASDGFYPTPAAAGILGLSFGNGSLCGSEHTCWPPLLDDLPGAGRDAFAICADGDKGGALVLGGVDEALAQAPIQYVSMLPPFAHYWIGVKDLRVNGSTLLPPSTPPSTTATDGGCNGPSSDPNKPDAAATACASRAVANETVPGEGFGGGVLGKAMVDTGNSAACLPEPAFDALRKRLEAAAPGVPAIADVAGGRTVFDGYGRRMTDAELALLPRVELVLEGDVVLALEPQDYLHDEAGYRYLKLIKYGHYAIGQTFLRKMYLVVDRANRRVGFAPPIAGCTPPPPGARSSGGGGGGGGGAP